jgi:hypothetical protein
MNSRDSNNQNQQPTTNTFILPNQNRSKSITPVYNGANDSQSAMAQARSGKTTLADHLLAQIHRINQHRNLSSQSLQNIQLEHLGCTYLEQHSMSLKMLQPDRENHHPFQTNSTTSFSSRAFVGPGFDTDSGEYDFDYDASYESEQFSSHGSCNATCASSMIRSRAGSPVQTQVFCNCACAKETLRGHMGLCIGSPPLNMTDADGVETTGTSQAGFADGDEPFEGSWEMINNA